MDLCNTKFEDDAQYELNVADTCLVCFAHLSRKIGEFLLRRKTRI